LTNDCSSATLTQSLATQALQFRVGSASDVNVPISTFTVSDTYCTSSLVLTAYLFNGLYGTDNYLDDQFYTNNLGSFYSKPNDQNIVISNSISNANIPNNVDSKDFIMVKATITGSENVLRSYIDLVILPRDCSQETITAAVETI